MGRSRKFAPTITPPDASETGRCYTCAKNNLADTACLVLVERVGLKEPCWSWTDDPQWEEKVEAAVRKYKAQGGGER